MYEFPVLKLIDDTAKKWLESMGLTIEEWIERGRPYYPMDGLRFGEVTREEFLEQRTGDEVV